jgi:transposase
MVYQRFQSLSPTGLLIDDVAIGPDRIVITARCRAAAAKCPDCGRQSERVHRRYGRRLLDLPSHGRTVPLQVAIRRFRRAEPDCRIGEGKRT